MDEKHCPVIGIVGGIGAGKSAAAKAFAELGALVVDADEIAHVVLDWPDVKERIEKTFGAGVLKDGRVSRQALSKIVFADDALLRQLNAIVHPAVIGESRRIIDAAARDADCKAVILDAPLIFETGLQGLCDVIVFVDADENTRKRRLFEGRGWDEAELERRQKFQDSLIYKRQQADYTVDNNGSPEIAARQVASIWKRVLGG